MVEIFYIIFNFGLRSSLATVFLQIFFSSSRAQVFDKILLNCIISIVTQGYVIPGLKHFKNPNCLSCGADSNFVSKLLYTFGGKYFIFTVYHLIFMSILSQAASRHQLDPFLH